MTTILQQRFRVKAQAFGARGCSCSCDPCDCDPCECEGARTPPFWRVSGYDVEIEDMETKDVSHLLLVSLAQPLQEGSREQWQEVILVDSRTTTEQLQMLLGLFEKDLHSLPAEVKPLAQAQKAVYLAPMAYEMGEEGPRLQVTFSPHHATLLRQGSPNVSPSEWNYDGFMALR